MTARPSRHSKTKYYSDLVRRAIAEKTPQVFFAAKAATSDDQWALISRENLGFAIEHGFGDLVEHMIEPAAKTIKAREKHILYGWLFLSIRRAKAKVVRKLFATREIPVDGRLLRSAIRTKNPDKIGIFMPLCPKEERITCVYTASRTMPSILPELLEDCETLAFRGDFQDYVSIANLQKIYFQGKACRPEKVDTRLVIAYKAAERSAKRRIIDIALIFTHVPPYVLLEICKKCNFWRLIGDSQEKRVVKIFQNARDLHAKVKHKKTKHQ